MSKTSKMREAPNNIAAARKEYEKRTGQKYTQNDAAQEFGVSLSTYRNYEQEHTLPDGGLAVVMAKKYGTTVDYLMGETAINYAVVSIGDSFTDDEKELISLYRKLSRIGKYSVLALLREFPGIENED